MLSNLPCILAIEWSNDVKNKNSEKHKATGPPTVLTGKKHEMAHSRAVSLTVFKVWCLHVDCFHLDRDSFFYSQSLRNCMCNCVKSVIKHKPMIAWLSWHVSAGKNHELAPKPNVSRAEGLNNAVNIWDNVVKFAMHTCNRVVERCKK